MQSTKGTCSSWILILSLTWGLSACGTSRAVTPVQPPVAQAQNIPAQPKTPFAGAWTVRWCEEPIVPGRPCGEFRAYLSQSGTRICGTYGGTDQRANRLDEGEPRSIVGTVVDSTAVITITSERNHGIYLVTAKLGRDTLSWDIVDAVKEGTNGEPALIADGDRLTRSTSTEDLDYLDEVVRDCTLEGAERDGPDR